MGALCGKEQGGDGQGPTEGQQQQQQQQQQQAVGSSSSAVVYAEKRAACAGACGSPAAPDGSDAGQQRWNNHSEASFSSSDNKSRFADKETTRPRDIRSADFSELQQATSTLSSNDASAGRRDLNQRFEALTNLCSTACKVPMCYISDLNSNLPWGSAAANPSLSARAAAPFHATPFCTWTLQQPPTAPLLVEDTLLDVRFSSSPLVVCAPYIRFYAGVPLVATDGTVLGVLSILDTRPAVAAAQSTESRLSLLASFANMAVRELNRERLLSVQQVAGDALLAERAKLLHLMDLVGHGTAVMLIEVPTCADGPSLQSASVDYSSGSQLLQTSMARTSSCRMGVSKSHWRVVCVNEAWEASTGHVNSRIANHSFWGLARAQGEEAEKTRRACVSAVAGRLSFSTTLEVGSGADAEGERVALRLLFNCTDKSRVRESNSPKSSITNLYALFAVPTASSCYYFVSIASASNPVVPSPSELHEHQSSGMLSGLSGVSGVTLLQEAPGSRKGTPRSSAKLEKLEDRSQQLLDEDMNVTKDLKVESLLGHGSFGRVYKGRYGRRPVAVKVLQCTLDQAGGHELEALLPAHIEHPNVLRTYKHCTRPLKEPRGCGAGCDSRMVETWMLMEYADHGSLSDAVVAGRFHGGHGHGDHGLLTSGPRSDDADLTLVLDTARDVASAMCHLHSLDILHGDLTGSNILLCSAPVDEDNRRIVAKVADFGLSRILASDRIRTKTYGAVSHTPPELLLSGSLSKAVDVYAFGVILWEMLTGQQPYGGLTQPQIINHISNGRSLDIRSDWPSGLRRLVAGCLSAQAVERPSFLQVLAQLEALQDQLC